MASSILTNNGAMTALQSLKATQKNLQMTQDRISTGLKVATAKDNAATWAVATSMRGEIANFKQVSENLSVSAGIVKTAAAGTEKIAELISKIREAVTSAQDGVKDAATVQSAIAEYRNQIESIVGSSAFKGVNLINNSREGNEKVLASVNMQGDVATPSYINIAAQNLTMKAGGMLEGMGRLTVERAKDNYTYAKPADTGVQVGDAVKFTFKVNGVEKVAEFAATAATGANLMEGLKNAINTKAGNGNAFATLDVSGNLVVNADLAADVVTFDGETALAVKTDPGNDLTLGAKTNNAPALPKYDYTLGTAPTVGDVYSFNFKVAGAAKVATYTALTGDDTAKVLKGVMNAINQEAGTGNEVASIDSNTGKLVVDAALGVSKIEFDGATALSKVDSTPGTVTADTTRKITFAPFAANATGGAAVTLTNMTVDGSAVTVSITSVAAQTPTQLAQALADEINDLADGVNDGAANAGTVASLSGSSLVIDAAAASGHLVKFTGSTAVTSADTTATAGAATTNITYDTYGFSTTNAVNDVITYGFTQGGTAKEAKITVEAGQTRAQVMANLAAAINAKAGSTVASVEGAVNSEVLAVDNTGLTATSLSVQTHTESVVSATKLTPTTSTDYKDLLGRLKTIETNVLAAGAAFGAAQTRIDLQKEFMDKLVDTLTTGVGALVDADMSEEAARLQALQVQQQLGTQALSIANQAPQTILALFRG